MRRSLVRIAIRRQTRTGPECRILTSARHLRHAGTIRRLGATTVISNDVPFRANANLTSAGRKGNIEEKEVQRSRKESERSACMGS